jgi:hypothetical protein
MIRTSSLLLATGLAILPIGAFAQQTVMPTATPAPMGQAASDSPAMTKAPSGTTSVPTKDAKTTHAKLHTTTPAAPAKAAEPSKS